MTLDNFRKSLTEANPPAELTLALAGLWWDAKGDWNQAHQSAQQDEGPEGGNYEAEENTGDPNRRCCFVDRAP